MVHCHVVKQQHGRENDTRMIIDKVLGLRLRILGLYHQLQRQGGSGLFETTPNLIQTALRALKLLDVAEKEERGVRSRYEIEENTRRLPLLPIHCYLDSHPGES